MKRILYSFILLSSLTLTTVSLTAQCDYELRFYDSFGDGWDGSQLEVFVNAGSVGTYTLANGDFSTDAIAGISEGDVIDVVYTAGSSSDEHEWALVDGLGNYVFSAPTVSDGDSWNGTAAACAPICAGGLVWNPSEVEIDLYDSFGDGWDGAILTVDVDDGTNNYSYAYTIFNALGSISEAHGIYTLTLPPSAGTWDLDFSFVGGAFDDEVTMTFNGVDGSLPQNFGPDPSDGLLLALAGADASACAAPDFCAIDCNTDMTFDLDPGECGIVVNHSVTLTGDCTDENNPFDVLDDNGIDGDMEGLAPTGWSSTSTNFGTVWCNFLCGGGAGSVNYGVAPNSNNFLARFGGALSPEVGTASFTANMPIASSAELCFAYENSVCGNPLDNIELTVDGNQVWIEYADPASCDPILDINTICIEVSAYADGGAHTFEWTGTQTTGNVTNMTVDNVSLTAVMHEFVQTSGSPDGEFITADETVTYVLTLNGVTVDVCSFDVEVNPFDMAIGSIACNDEVNISLGDDCTFVVTADQVLEGGPYTCYDLYTVVITDAAGNNYGNMVTEANLGQTLTATVTGPNGNSCWGEIMIEDKNPPALMCEDVYASCTDDLEPGSDILNSVTYSYSPGTIIDDGAPSTVDIPLDVSGLTGGTITDVDVTLDISHSWVNDVSATLTSPEGTTVQLFFNPPCINADISVELDDEATATSTDLLFTCNASSPTVEGTFQPFTALSFFDGEDPNGTWMLSVSDIGFGEGGSVDNVGLVITQSGAKVSFPIEEPFTILSQNGNQYTVTGLDACTEAVLSYSDTVDEDCDNSPYKVITRKWQAQDAYGNLSECTQIIYVSRKGLSEVVFPLNFDGNEQPVLTCEPDIDPPNFHWDLNGNEYPDPEETGVPTIDGIDIYPNLGLCKINITFTDTEIPICGNSFKILREWQALDWCTGEVLGDIQIIKVEDVMSVVACGEAQVVFTDAHRCATDYTVPNPFLDPSVLILSCSELSYTVEYLTGPDVDVCPPEFPGLFTDDGVVTYTQGGYVYYTIPNLPKGCTWLRYIFENECGQTDTCRREVKVVDNVPPVAVCDEFTVVGIGADGWGSAPAITFDDGSNDNCEIDYFEVRKMTNKCLGVTLEFGPEAIFCCEEVGDMIMVEMRVWDKEGNANSCMVEVTVQDKLPPYAIVCPPDVTIDCNDDYYDLSIYGEAEFIDNCDNFTVTYTVDENLDNCGRGYITRLWEAIDQNNGFKGVCEQTITIENESPFDEFDIFWPFDYTTDGCDIDLHPDNLPFFNAYPRILDDKCSLAASTYEDQVFEFADGSCRKILREWTVIDWCTYDPETGEGLWVYRHQILKQNNLEAPVFENCQDTVVCIYAEGCYDEISYSAIAHDDCTADDELQWRYEIDLYNAGDGYDLFGESNTFVEFLSAGTHGVKWTVEDRCGNIEVCKQLLTIRDCKHPTPYCYSSITTVVMNNNGMVEIWASDFDLGSFDNCTAHPDLIFSFSKDTSDRNILFGCSDLGPDGAQETIPLEMWVTDEAGNQDFCDVFIQLQDNNGNACPDVTGLVNQVSGRVSNENHDMVNNVELTVSSDINGYPKTFMTDEDGSYIFQNLLNDESFYVDAYKEDEHINGVSTLDLLLIQKHILGLNVLDSPYKIIAADASNDETISAVDLIWMRKLILGIVNEFPNDQEAWRFVDNDFEFANPSDPFPYDEILDFVDISQSYGNKDFMAVKIGDVNISAKTNNLSNDIASNRGQALMLAIDDKSVDTGIETVIPVYAENFNDILGFQFTLEFDENMVDLVDIIGASVELKESNIGYVYSDQGIVTMSWNNTAPLSVTDEEALFNVVLRAKSDYRTTEILSVSSTITEAEAYNDAYEIKDVIIVSRDGGEILSDKFELLQNEPNPFSNTTRIGFNLPEAGIAHLNVYDVSGRLVTSYAGDYEKGYNSVTIKNTELSQKGVLYYILSTDKYTATKKMISL